MHCVCSISPAAKCIPELMFQSFTYVPTVSRSSYTSIERRSEGSGGLPQYIAQVGHAKELAGAKGLVTSLRTHKHHASARIMGFMMDTAVNSLPETTGAC